ncbi:MAG: aminoacyl-tRNA hydrolase [Anaerolineae bacterium]|nr:aminoacyl-tRNA hydrolase [Anaerolineae bacterium]
MSEFVLIVGLGNIGPRYAGNRHNIGFQAVDALAQSHGLSFSRSEHHAAVAHGMLNTHRVVLAKPQTWMNDSGKAVAPLLTFYKIPPERMLVLYDDLDIPLGTLRFRQEGSSGGHRGVQSIIQHTGTQGFPRLRLGIGRPPGRMDPAAYVLQDFDSAEQAILHDVLRLTHQLTLDWLAGARELNRPGMTWRIASLNTETAPET